ncbi:MAG: hypothetical protein GY949_16505 [Gammaproteobacteria bacterium]|nr:hypothetical protein [Gammaproteobacteria bacterium]
MPDSKHMRWVDGFGTDAEHDLKADDTNVEHAEPAANDAGGWKQYRRWISKAPAPRGRRAGIDPALYTWKGYRDWSDQVKRNWIKDADNE